MKTVREILGRWTFQQEIKNNPWVIFWNENNLRYTFSQLKEALEKLLALAMYLSKDQVIHDWFHHRQVFSSFIVVIDDAISSTLPQA